MQRDLASAPLPGSHGALLALVAFGLLVRIALFFAYAPIEYPDTGTYFALAAQLANLDPRSYDGGRTPGYPLLIVAAGQIPTAVYALQALSGVVASVLLFLIGRDLGRSTKVAFLIGLLPTIALNQLFMEANLLPEQEAAFLAVVSTYISVRMLTRGSTIGRAALLGALICATVLTRPGYIALVPVFAAVPLLAIKQGHRLRDAGIYAATACLPIVAWMALNASLVGQFALSTRLGIGLMNHSGAFIEYADPKYSVIRDIYLRHRAEVVKSPEALARRGGEQYLTIFYALRDLEAATGMSQPALSKELSKLSFDLFRKHPLLYMESVFKACLGYWTAPNYWQPDMIRFPAVAAALERLWRWEQLAIRIANLLFVAAVVALFASAAHTAKTGSFAALARDRFVLALALIGGSVLWFSIFQGFFEYGENGRYSIPTQMLGIAFTILAVSQLRERWRVRLLHTHGASPSR